MLSGDVFVAQAVGFLVGEVDDPLDARGDKHLIRAVPVDRRFRAGAQDFVQTRTHRAHVHRQSFENLRDHAVGLFQQGEQDVLGIDLIVTVALQNFVGSCGGVLRAFGKSLKTHHSGLHLMLRRLYPIVVQNNDA